MLFSALPFVLSAKPVQEAKAADYYASINNTMKGDTLKVALYNIIKGHTKYSYSSLEVAMRTTDRDWARSPDPDDENPYMVLLYADYNDTNPQKWNKSQGSYGSTKDYSWNKEHIWAKSNGFNSQGAQAYSDLHHLRASDWKLNNIRSNKPFANGGSYAKDAFNNTSTCKSASNTFEPSDQYKGDVARALFYMATRYYNGDGSTGTKLTLTNGTDSSGGKWGYLDTLLEWNELDPPDSFEIHRNDLVYEIQKNRNPYIDHPEYARAVFKDEAIVTPDTPDTPVTPDDPVEPDTPDTPDTQVDPDVPDEPDTPVEPDDPVNPDDPDEPDTPDTPDDPVEPEVIHVSEIVLSRSNLELSIGQSFSLAYVVAPDNATNKNVTWSSSNEEIATVDNGVIQAIKAGECDIKITAEDGNVSATCHVKVKDKGNTNNPSCGGNILATSIILSSISLLGVILLTFKKIKRYN